MDSQDLEKLSKDSGLTERELQEFYNRRKSIIWVIRLKYKVRGVESVTFGTGFSVSSDGLIFTSAHFFPKTSYTIDVRRLEEVGSHSANVVYEKPKWDITLLQVIDVNDCQYATLTDNDSLSVAQTLLHIGNPDNFVGSFLVGKVAFGCVDDIEIPIGSVTCRTYAPTAMETPPKFRIMGDVWNEHVLGNSSVGKSFEKNLHPCTPIIQMYGLICGEGSSGGPVFNVKGEVVGMVSGSASGYEYAIHVAMLREILKLFKEQNPGN
ncbi:PREDICTED: uncharacterized protein LOC109207750 [Nicotiana attenuata]|uniref:Serine protease n=1 Tax=Nicotiana attenuata TaxID=49451 RepID=A0A1J6JGC0_NICAT|nr:PREDICTED: uncharacterized protein LOC109207750 [Nicotiana attenuata]OIT06041.1 hypothetical protein A4A49_22827 [Nicotiana attenuata]